MTIPVGSDVKATEDIPYIDDGRVIERGTRGVVRFFYEVFNAYQVKFEGFGKDQMVAPSQIERA